MKKLFITLLLLWGVFSEAKILNGVAIVVNGEPITIAEIDAVQSQLHVSKKEAQNMLIENRLQKAAMKNITVSEEDIDERISLVAKQNSMSVQKMQEVIKGQNQSWNAFRDQMKVAIQKQKFFRSEIAKTISQPSEDELKFFYDNHPEQFSTPSSITVMEYSAASAEKIQTFLQNTNETSGIRQTKRTFQGTELTPQLLAMISQTQIGALTPAFNNGSAFVSYMILEKGANQAKPFDQVKEAVIMAWKKEQQTEAIKKYFEKLKKNASIEIIRP